MSDEIPARGRTNGIRQSSTTDTIDVLEVKLPLKPEYLPVARAAAGVIAGGMSFNYDEVIQGRVAVAEAFELTMMRTGWADPASATPEVVIRFTIALDRLEILIAALEGTKPRVSSLEVVEGESLLQSLMDRVDLQDETEGASAIRLIKYRAPSEA